MTDNPEKPHIKDVIGPGWMKPLAQRTGIKDGGRLSRLVNYEDTKNPNWRHVEDYAREVNPAGFAEWEAAHAQAA